MYGGLRELLIPCAARVRLGDERAIAFTLDPAYLPYAKKLFAEGMVKTNDCYEVRVRMKARRRSTGPGSASNHFHGHAAQIAGALGYTMDQMKYILKCEAGAMGYPSEMWKGLVIPKSEADATPEEESALIETSHRIAAENGVELKED